MSDIQKQLQAARQRLLDLTGRNRLLNYRPTKRRTIRVIDEVPREVFDILVLQERVMQFKPAEKPDLTTSTVENGASRDTEEEEEKAPVQWLQDMETEQHHTDRLLQTELARDELQKRLYYIHQQARSVFEEQGYSVLYLAIGYLEWRESASAEQVNHAPLILIPVELERQKVRTQFRLRWSGAELFPNLSLEAKLAEQSIELPTLGNLEDKADMDAYFQAVSEAVATQNWNVVPDIYLDFFSFTKFVMYKDLEPEAWDMDVHPLLGTILGGATGSSGNDGFKPEEVDLRLPSQSLYHVMDADSSQIAVIEDIKNGKNLVVEGPPGTGKSQTITNIIAELLAEGKNVLFVSEKMAALEVVKNRLDRVGLGDFCLELHSHKSNKREVLQELERTLTVQPPQGNRQDNTFTQVDFQKAELNAYVNALQEPIGETGKSPYALFGIRETARRYFEDVHRPMPHIDFSRVGNPAYTNSANLETPPTLTACSPRDWTLARQRLESLVVTLPNVMPVGTHPWRGCAPGIITPLTEAEINTQIEKCKAALDTLDAAIQSLADVCGIHIPDTPAALQYAKEAVDVMLQAIPVAAEILENAVWHRPNAEADALIQKVEVIKKELSTVHLKFPLAVLAHDIAALHKEYKMLSRSWLRIFNSRHNAIKREIRGFYRTAPPRRPELLMADLKVLEHCIALRQEIRELEKTGRSFFGEQWRGEESHPRELREFAKWIVQFRKYLLEGTLTQKAVGMVSSGGVSREQVESCLTRLASAENNFMATREALFNRLGTDAETLFGVATEQVPFAELRERLAVWQNKGAHLHLWAQFLTQREACRDTMAQPCLELIEEISPSDMVPCFEGNLADALLHEAFVNRLPLQDFVGALHEKKITDFYELDRTSIELNRQRLVGQLHQHRPRLQSGASRNSEVGILQGQFNRKRGHLPIRKLLSEVGGLIQKIKPCFMMSPLSVAQFCDPRMIHFDVIVFDEASQIRPEDALGALLRAEQAVVIGDTRQLPPTRFFDSIIEDVEEDEDDVTTSLVDVESILHQCRGAFPTKELKWHYRSRHESLIAVSNQEFYDNNLLIFPSPFDEVEHLGLKFVHLPDAVYDRGRSATNRKEAEAVVQAAFAHYRQYPDKSLGIGTFNMKQQQAILDEVEVQLRQHPEMEQFFVSSRDEHFFVKNLETIQGDERDAIFLSIGYGFDPSHRLHRNFGPLNHEGGHRRLNVLITRARERCLVFSNFRASDLQLDATAPRGARALKVFLDYAENRNLRTALPTGGDTDSPFEDAVYEFLTSHGHTVSTQVGCAGYRIDLAVVDMAAPGRYLIGVECDGAQYHSSPVARDRDRLRQQVLEGLGWNLHRIWSTDWYRNRMEAEQKLLEAVERAKTVTLEKQGPARDPEPVQVLPDKPETEINPEPQPPPEPSLSVADYVACADLGIPIQGELSAQTPAYLAQAVIQVVDVEGPVHRNEVVLRIRSLWGVKKAGRRIKEAIDRGILSAQRKRSGGIRCRGDFLWTKAARGVHVRRRERPNIAWICEEEIAEAMKQVLTSQGAILPDALITEAAKLFGYRTAGKTVVARMEPLVEKLVQEGTFQLAANGRVSLP